MSEWTMQAAVRQLSDRISVNSVVDLGAYAGGWSVMAREFFPDAEFLLVEPLIEMVPHLQNTGMRYELCVASDTDRGARLNVTGDLYGSGVYGGTDYRDVQSRTLDDLCDGLAGPILLKFDTHGMEFPILSGGRKTISKVDAILMECYNYVISPTSMKFWQMCEVLDGLGFACSDIADPMRRPEGSFWQMDMIFLKKGHIIVLWLALNHAIINRSCRR